MLCASCVHISELKHETGYVVEKQYVPDTRQTVTGTGISSNGSVVFTSHAIGEQEKYVVIFKCDHGVLFAKNDMDLYGNLNKGDTVIIDYYEVLSDGSNEIVDLDFVSAHKN